KMGQPWRKKKAQTQRAKNAAEFKLKLLQSSNHLQPAPTTMTASNMYFEKQRNQQSTSHHGISMKIPSVKKPVYDESTFRGRRIFSCDSILSFVFNLNKHMDNCKRIKLAFSHEVRKFGGLDRSTILTCQCGHSFEISSDTGIESLPINEATIWGCMVSPVGYGALSNFLTTLDLPVPCPGFFSKLQNNGRISIFEGAEKELVRAGAEELRLAKEAGDVIEVEGKSYYKITVVVDGGWSKRSFGHSYNANCGIGVIIGYRTRKAENIGVAAELHDCYRNFDQPSTAMEADAIAEGFAKSIQMHGLVYHEFVGDGDSSVHAKVIILTVKKVECINHAMRNFNRKLMDLSCNLKKGKNSPDIPQEERQIEGMAKYFDRLGKGVRGAIDFHHQFCEEQDRYILLDQDIMNVPFHVFGDHTKCRSYFCPPDGERRKEENRVPEMQTKVIWKTMMKHITKLASLSTSLIHKKDTNCVEAFMSVANKYMEGKRKHLGASYLYRLRMCCAVFSYNVCGFWLPDLYYHIYGVPPQSAWITVIKRKQRIKKKAPPRQISFGFLKARKGDQYYGDDPTRPDMEDSVLQLRINDCYEGLQSSSNLLSNKQEINQNVKSGFSHRRERMTASIAGKLYKLQPTSDNTSTLNSMLRNQSFRGTAATKYGLDSEPSAILSYELKTGLPEGSVEKVGLEVSLENGIFAASPDGRVGEEGIVEIKCPYSIRDLKPHDWPTSSSDCPLKLQNGTLVLKTTHNHYFQIVQQLHVTKRMWCDYVVWTPNDIFIQRIERNEETASTWEKMKMKLQKFWTEDLAPELVDSRLERGYKDYRCPESRLVGRKRLEESRKKRQLKKSAAQLSEEA
ncbi:hypothetical protein Ocin01_11442, partial [Orchesella cincta]